jgi:Tfp pilus assembly protein PilF
MQYKNTKKSLPEIARELNVDGIIEGTVERFGDRVRVTAQLMHGPSDRQLWSKSYERDLRDVFDLERDVTGDIAFQVQARLTTPEHDRPAQPRQVEPRVLEAYLQGNDHLVRSGEGFGWDEELDKAAEDFQKAIDADPNFAPAYNGLATAYQNRLTGSSEGAAIARRAAEKAVELDPNYSDAQATLGYIKWQPYLDWRGAEANFRRAIAINPNNADAHSQFGEFLVAMGHRDEGVRECHLAQQLNPNKDSSSGCLFWAHDYDGSIAILRMMLWKNPNDSLSHAILFDNYLMKGMHKEAMQELAETFSSGGFPKEATNIRHAFAVSGYQGALRQAAKEIEHSQEAKKAYMPGSLAELYTALGDKDRAFYWLEQAYEHREMTSKDEGIFYLGAEPLYDALRSDPRYKELLRRIGLPP